MGSTNRGTWVGQGSASCLMATRFANPDRAQQQTLWPEGPLLISNPTAQANRY